jgi:hypothetical protein
LNPFVGVTVATAIPGCVAVTVTLDGATERVKFPAAGVMLIEAAVEVDAEKFASLQGAIAVANEDRKRKVGSA